jgi:N4-gp56 family major capsid protein
MAQFEYASPAGRINKTKGEILGHAQSVEVLGKFGLSKQLPKNAGAQIVWRSYLPYGAAATNLNTQNRPAVTASAHVLNEGVTPTADTLIPRDVTGTIAQYGALYSYTDKTADLYEDDVPSEMKKQLGERMGLLKEMIVWGELKSGTNLYYGGTGTTVATVNGEVSVNMLRKISRNLQANHAKRITSILDAAPKFGTAPVEAGYVVVAHTDLEATFREMPGFKHVAEYGNRKVLSEHELGSVENFRVILSPELAADANAATSVTASTYGLYTTGGTNPDVYTFVVLAEDAFGDLALRGAGSVDVSIIPCGTKDKSDPLGQRGYIGGKFYATTVLLNQGWMAVGKVGAKAL